MTRVMAIRIRRSDHRGPASFVVTADGGAPFAEAVRRTLLLEIGGTAPASEVAVAERP
jgi:hypothetical protein